MKSKMNKKPTYRSIEIFIDLRHAKPTVAKLRNSEKGYDFLIDEIMEMVEGKPYPRNKDLQMKYNLQPAKLKKLIDTLYEDFHAAIFDNPDMMTIEKASYWIYGEGYKGHFGFSCRLPVTPRVGEKLDLPFVRALVGTTSFYVSRIDHEIEGNEQLINITLKQGSYNRYFNFALDRALLENRISISQYFQLPNFELEKIIHHWYKK
jgi:hypothetical protein